MKYMKHILFFAGISVVAVGCGRAQQPRGSNGNGSDLSEDLGHYEAVANIVKQTKIPVQELNEPSSECAWSDHARTEQGDKLPGSLGGVFRYYEKRSRSRSGACEGPDSALKCKVEVENGESFTLRIEFALDSSHSIVKESIKCFKAG